MPLTNKKKQKNKNGLQMVRILDNTQNSNSLDALLSKLMLSGDLKSNLNKPGF